MSSLPPPPLLEPQGQPTDGHGQLEEHPQAQSSSSANVQSLLQPLTSNAPPVSRLPTYYSVEYPGYVQPQPSSLAHAVKALGGQKAINNAFSEGGRILELRLQPDNPFAHPVTGDVVNTNKLLVKVVTRRKKKSSGDSSTGPNVDAHELESATMDKGKGKEVQSEGGTYSAEVIGVIPKTVRFRSMADFQYQPDENDYIVQMRRAMDRLDVDAIRSFEFKPLKENYSGTRLAQSSNTTQPDQMDIDIDPELLASTTSNPGPKSQLQLIPPPLFSRQGISQHYNLKQNPMSVIHSTVDPKTGEETRRYIHKHRLKGSLAPASISWDSETVPTEPPQQILDAKSQAKPHLLAKLKELFTQRPVWSRVALINQFPALEGREIQNTKAHIGLVSYTFSDGAWRDTLLRLGYDPRKDPQARFYQRVYFRNTANEEARRKSIVGRRAGGDNAPEVVETAGEDRRSHIFDGKTLHSGAASFQLCDITDSLLVPLINDEGSVRKEPDIADGWYTAHEFALIKAVVRRKHFNLLQGKVISDKDCADLFVPGGLSSSNTIVRAVSASANKKFPRKAKSNRRPVAPERLMAAELEIALRKDKDAANAREASRVSESEADGNGDAGDAMEEDG